MYFYQQVNQLNYQSVVDYLMTRAHQNGINPDETNDIMIFWDDSEQDNDDEGEPPLLGNVYISKELLNLV
jgi:hypothetical protein